MVDRQKAGRCKENERMKKRRRRDVRFPRESDYYMGFYHKKQRKPSYYFLIGLSIFLYLVYVFLLSIISIHSVHRQLAFSSLTLPYSARVFMLYVTLCTLTVVGEQRAIAEVRKFGLVLLQLHFIFIKEHF